MRKINYGSHQVDLNDLSLIKKVLKSNHVTQGNFVKNFENKVSSYLNSKYAVSCNSGTAAIHMAFDALNINSKSIRSFMKSTKGKSLVSGKPKRF